jgi:hypothetical protein
MPRQRDGPAPGQTTPGPKGNEGPRLLPPSNFPRKPASAARDLPKPTSTERRRRPPHWRGFAIRLYAPPGTNGAHALYLLLKLAAQRYGLEVGKVREFDPRS